MKLANYQPKILVGNIELMKSESTARDIQLQAEINFTKNQLDQLESQSVQNA